MADRNIHIVHPHGDPALAREIAAQLGRLTGVAVASGPTLRGLSGDKPDFILKIKPGDDLSAIPSVRRAQLQSLVGEIQRLARRQAPSEIVVPGHVLGAGGLPEIETFPSRDPVPDLPRWRQPCLVCEVSPNTFGPAGPFGNPIFPGAATDQVLLDILVDSGDIDQNQSYDHGAYELRGLDDAYLGRLWYLPAEYDLSNLDDAGNPISAHPPQLQHDNWWWFHRQAIPDPGPWDVPTFRIVSVPEFTAINGNNGGPEAIAQQHMDQDVPVWQSYEFSPFDDAIQGPFQAGDEVWMAHHYVDGQWTWMGYIARVTRTVGGVQRRVIQWYSVQELVDDETLLIHFPHGAFIECHKLANVPPSIPGNLVLSDGLGPVV